MIPMGMQEAITAIIGTEIGANNVRLARRYNRVISTIATVVVLTIALTVYFGRYQITRLFTEEQAVSALTVEILKIVAILIPASGG